jgi:chromosome segregation ATPase
VGSTTNVLQENVLKISNLTIQSFQGIDYLKLDINKNKPITLIGGKNATGKTSIKDAIRLALTGESGRVGLKKDYIDMVRRGANAKEAFVSITADGFTWNRGVATGKSEEALPDYPFVLPYLLGDTKFAELPSREQMPILYKITGTSATPKVIVGMLEDMAIAEECIVDVTPILRLGFEKAHKHCKEQQSQARGAWKAVTGETWGVQKAASWTAPLVEYDTEELEDQISILQGNIDSAESELAEATKAYHAGQEEMDKRNKKAVRDAGKERIQKAHSTVYTCPCCEENLTMTADGLIPWVKPKEEKIVEEKPEEPQEELPPILNRNYYSLVQQMSQLNAELAKAQGAEAKRDDQEYQARKWANAFHEWDKTAKALDSDGIPLRIVKKALKPVNDRLKNTSVLTGWGMIEIHRDLSITYDGTPYNLCSESEKWRVDCAIAEAISLLSEVGFFVLDRMDVLHPEERIHLIQWLLSIKAKHDSIIIMATLKTKPTGMPKEYITALWLTEGGELERA